jgi:hypothetical protein
MRSATKRSATMGVGGDKLEVGIPTRERIQALKVQVPVGQF